MPIKVLIVDDSALMRAVLTEIIAGAPDLQVVGTAPDPLVAREMIKALDPDVLTLDVEMPKMDGLDFLRRLMKLRPMPVVMVSSLTEKGSETTLQALELGAVDFVPKPRIDDDLGEYASEVREKIRSARGARLAARGARPAGPVPAAERPFAGVQDRLIAIGASTGGTEAIRDVLAGLPAGLPPVFIVQHMPEMFTASFARRLDAASALRVKEACDGERAESGCAYLAPGHSHLRVRRRGGLYCCELSQDAPVNRHRPSVDVLFESVAAQAPGRGLGVILTGMGKDGARGLLAMREGGAWTVAQDQASCVVYGMPREAALLGAAQEVVPLAQIGARVLAALSEQRARGRGLPA